MLTLQRRIGFLFAGIFVALLLAAARAAYLGVLRGPSLREAAHSEHVTDEPLPAGRGTITDRNGEVLAMSEPAYDISADPYLITEPATVAAQIAPLLGAPVSAVLAQLQQHAGFVYLAHGLEATRARRLLALGLPGIEGTPVMRRVYPDGQLAGQVLGALGAEGVGLGGLEYSLGTKLAGRNGMRRVVRDGIGQPISVATVRRERPGESVRLTLDANIQARAEAVLSADAAVFHPHDATAIVMEPATGAILAMAGWPPVNLSSERGFTPEALEDRAVSFTYEPGSTFKVVAMAGALQEGVITPQTSFQIPEQLEIGGRVIHDAESHPAESLTASQILAQSSNIGAVKIAMLDGASNFSRWTRTFGFGERTGIELPGEEPGDEPPLSSYSEVSIANLPFGQGETVTPIQLITAYAAIADGGVLRRPHIVEAIDGRRVPLSPGRRIISPTTAQELRAMLRGPLQPGGTAAEVSIPGYQLAGKTGTAEKVNAQTGEYSKSAFVASFVGFAPVSHPRLLALVMVDEPQEGSVYGGQVAAPAWGQIMSFGLSYLSVAPE